MKFINKVSFWQIATIVLIVIVAVMVGSKFAVNQISIPKEVYIPPTKINFNPYQKFMYELSFPNGYNRTTKEELAGEEYPKELLELDDENLVSFACGPQYRPENITAQKGEDPDYVYVSKNGYKVSLDNKSSLYAYLLAIHKKYDIPLVSSAQLCQKSEEEQLLIFSVNTGLTESRRGDGGAADYYFTEVFGGELLEPAAIPSNGAAYGGCSEPLAITSENILYARCGGGDGGMSKSSLYKIDMNERSVETLLSCTNELGKISCE